MRPPGDELLLPEDGGRKESGDGRDPSDPRSLRGVDASIGLIVGPEALFVLGDRSMASALATGELFMVRSRVRLGTRSLSGSSWPVIGDTIDWWLTLTVVVAGGWVVGGGWRVGGGG